MENMSEEDLRVKMEAIRATDPWRAVRTWDSGIQMTVTFTCGYCQANTNPERKKVEEHIMECPRKEEVS